MPWAHLSAPLWPTADASDYPPCPIVMTTHSNRPTDPTAVTFLEVAATLQPDLVALRRALHAVPELGLVLPQTQSVVLRALAGLPLEIVRHNRTSGIVAVLRGQRFDGEHPVVLLRADMDALPLLEQTDLPFSCPEQRMHACGHDLHTAMLVGAVQLLAQRRAELRGDVVFMFQPGEEGYDGAQHMIDEGVLTAAGRMVDAAYALHVNPAVLPFGTVATRAGTLLSAVGRLEVRVIGEGGHGSRPARARDPVPVLAEIVLALQTMVTRQFDIFDPIVLSVGVLEAGTQHNIIPEDGRIEATVRTFSDRQAQKVAEQARRLCEGVAAGHGLRAEITFEHLYPCTLNTPSEADRFLRVAAALFGAEAVHEYPHPQPGSEDFSRVLEAVPGAMAFLGACPVEADPETAAYNHSARATYDERVLSRGAALLAAITCDRLDEGQGESGSQLASP